MTKLYHYRPEPSGARRGRTMTTSNATVPVPAGEDAEPSPPAKRKGALPTVSGSGPSEWNDSLVAGIAQVCAGSDLRGDDMGAAAKRAGIEAMAGIGPGDVIADMVAAQLVSAHHAAMDCYKRAAGGGELVVWREALNQANRLSRTSAALIEGEGGGDDPGAEHQCHARGPAVRCENAARDAMQGAGDAQWPMPDARREAARSATRQPLCVEAWPLQWRGDPETARGRRADTNAARSHAPDLDVNRGEGRRWNYS